MMRGRHGRGGMDMEQLAPKAAEAESFLKAMASRHRLMILCELQEGELSVSALQEALGLGQSSLSQHLARLRADGLVETRRVSQTIYYRIDNPKVSRMMQALYESFCADEKKPAIARKTRRVQVVLDRTRRGPFRSWKSGR